MKTNAYVILALAVFIGSTLQATPRRIRARGQALDPVCRKALFAREDAYREVQRRAVKLCPIQARRVSPFRIESEQCLNPNNWIGRNVATASALYDCR